MDSQNKKCEECGDMLGFDQYISYKPQGFPSVRMEDNLICRNSPKCGKAQKDYS